MNLKTFDTITKDIIGEKIVAVNLNTKDDRIEIDLNGGNRVILLDRGQSCCERRYITTDDDLSTMIGSTFQGAETTGYEEREAEYDDVHEVTFLLVHTSVGTYTFETHNEHNGYYGGFIVEIEIEKTPPKGRV
jgi:hypothetical protein